MCSVGMATPPTSNCDDVSQDSSGTFCFSQAVSSSTNLSNSKIAMDNNVQHTTSTQHRGNKHK